MRNKVLEWINKSGFPLEMESAKAFRNAGFDVRQSATHLDLEERKGREIDVLASDPDWIGVVEINYVLECKSSDKPWVVLMADNTLENYNRALAFSVLSSDAKEAVFANWKADGVFKELLEKPSRCGYGLRQALGGQNDKAFSAAISVLKACSGLTTTRHDSNTPRYSFAFPIIVVDTPIFECSLSDNGELDLVEVQESEFLFSAYLPHYTSCCIKVLKRDCLDELAHKSKKIAETIREAFKDHESKAFEMHEST